MADNSILIFVVEDEPTIRELLTHDLEEAGFSVALIASGDEAIKKLSDKGTNYRALITDINLGDDVTGWDVARHARRINAELPVIYMTGNDDPAIRKAAAASGCVAFLTKPFSTQSLIEPLKKASAGH